MHYGGEKLGQNGGKVIGFWPQTKACLLSGPPTSEQIFIKIEQKLRPYERGQADRQTEERNGTDKNIWDAIRLEISQWNLSADAENARKKNAGLENAAPKWREGNAGLENARKGKVLNTASFLKYRVHIFHSSHGAQTATRNTQTSLSTWSNSHT